MTFATIRILLWDVTFSLSLSLRVSERIPPRSRKFGETESRPQKATDDARISVWHARSLSEQFLFLSGVCAERDLYPSLTCCDAAF
jgi:hypothetical protein